MNNYRWVRGFNDYDNWQASGVSGQGARSFYYPTKSQSCADCHMPLVASHDPGNREGQIHSHRFPGANTAVAYANQDESQLRAEEEFLKSGFITVDIFAASPVDDHNGHSAMLRRTDTPRANTTFAVGEEAEQQGDARHPRGWQGRGAARFFRREARAGQRRREWTSWCEPVRSAISSRAAPWTRSMSGWNCRPAMPMAASSFGAGAWPMTGEVRWNPAHISIARFSSTATAIRSTSEMPGRRAACLYVRLIPPGAADVAHYLVRVPKDARGPMQFTAKLNYRKFAWYYTQFAYGAHVKAGQDPKLLTVDHNSLDYEFGPQFIRERLGRLKIEFPMFPS